MNYYKIRLIATILLGSSLVLKTLLHNVLSKQILNIMNALEFFLLILIVFIYILIRFRK